ncbi:MAG: response regulator transcription factor [Bacteriovorax sp.]|nr:response regulator transcription factor [Bacteriovorax sp.]
MNNILYIDDNAINLSNFKDTFVNDFCVTTSQCPLSVFNLLESQKYDAILLDIHMPERDGFEVLKEISESRFSSIPALMFTSDELQAIRYRALATRACDIIYRTLSNEEIKLRILNKIQLFSKKTEEEKHLKLGSLSLNLETLEAFHQTKNLNLTPIEFKMLSALIKNYPEKISREALIKKAWNAEMVLDRTVNTHLTNLRHKIPKEEFVIESPRGTGIVLKKVIFDEQQKFSMTSFQ